MMDFIITIILLFLFVLFYKINKIIKTLREIKKLLLPNNDGLFLEFYTNINGRRTKVDQMFLKISDKQTFSVEPKDKFGNLAQIDGKPQWSVTDESLAALEVAEDGFTAVVIPKGVTGSFKLQAKGDADLGEGVKEILGEAQIDLLPGEAVTFELKAGAVEPQ